MSFASLSAKELVMNITINLAVILLAVFAMTFKWMKKCENAELVMLIIFVTIPSFVASLFSLCFNWNFTLSNVFCITFS